MRRFILVAVLAAAACAGKTRPPAPPAPPPAAGAETPAAPPRGEGFRYRFEGDDRWSGWIPMQDDRTPIVRARIGGIDKELMLDTGAGVTVIDRALADLLGLATRPFGKALGPDGSPVPIAWVEGVTIELDGVTLYDVPTVALDFGPLAAMRGGSMPAILGTQVFHALVTELDFPRGRVAFYDPAYYAYASDGVALTPRPARDHRVAVDVGIEDQPLAPFLLDTGSESALYVFTEHAESSGLLADRPTSTALIGGVGGVATVRVATVRDVAFAGVTLEDVPISIHPAGRDDNLAGILGIDILSRFRVVIDYTRDVVYAEPGPDATAPLPKDRSGLQLTRTADGLRVEHVATDSPAAAAGIPAGAIIVAVDDAEPTEAFRHAPAGTRVELRTADGTEYTLILADYF